MATEPSKYRLAILAGACAAVLAWPASPQPAHPLEALDWDEIGLMGNAGHVPDSTKPKLTAYFEQESYRPGDAARMVVADFAQAVSVQVFRAGEESEPTLPHDVMLGGPVTPVVAIGAVEARRVVPG